MEGWDGPSRPPYTLGVGPSAIFVTCNTWKMDCEEPWEVQLLREFCGSELSLEGVRVHVAETRLGVCFVLVTHKIE